jgi:hypothetical protein
MRSPKPRTRNHQEWVRNRDTAVSTRSFSAVRRANILPRLWSAFVPGLFFLLAANVALAQSYTVDWSTVDGGGGTSTGGVYSVSGTIGQPDAGRMSGGSFTVQGGFWAIIEAVQTPGAPLLSVRRTETNSVLVSWPLPADSWVLEQTPALGGGPASWTQISPPYQTNSTQSWIVVPMPTGNGFYRLHKP